MASIELPAESPLPSLPNDDPYEVLRTPGYARFLLAGMAVTIGGQMQSVAVGWELYVRTKSPMALAMVGLAQVLPVILLAIPAGHAADRYSRKLQIMLAVGLMGVASSALAIISRFQGPIGLAYVCLVVTGTAHAIYNPARWAILTQVVPRSLLPKAVTWNSSSWQTGAMAGPALGGLVIWWTEGATAAYVCDCCCSIFAVFLIGSIRLRPFERSMEPLSRDSLLAGIRFVCSTELILATITLDLFAVLLGGAVALLPIFAEDILRIGPRGLGWLRAAPSIGAFLMAFTLAHRRPMQHAGPALLWSVSGFGVATIVFGFSRNAYLSFAMLLLTGAFDNISVVVRSTLVQVLTPDSMRGRVSAVNSIFIGSSNELGEFESGVTARMFGAVAATVGGGVGTLIVVGIVSAVWPSLLRLGALHAASLKDETGA